MQRRRETVPHDPVDAACFKRLGVVAGDSIGGSAEARDDGRDLFDASYESDTYSLHSDRREL